MKLTVSEIAEKLGGALEGPGDAEITGVAGIREAREGELSFQVGQSYAVALPNTGASAVLLARDSEAECPCAVIRVETPETAFAEVAAWFAPPAVKYEPGTDPTAVIHPTAQIGEDVYVGPHCVIEAGAKIGARTVLCAQCFIGRGVVVGENGLIYPQVSIREYTVIGARAIIHCGAVIGSDGFGYFPKGETWQKIPQIGTVQIGDDVEIGACVTIDRARFGKTVIGDGCKIDNLVQIAHNVQVGAHSAMAGQVGISGSAIIGKHVQLGGQSGVGGHLTIGDNTTLAAKSGIHGDTPANTVMMGSPAMPRNEFRKFFSALLRVPQLRVKLSEMEKRLAALEKSKDA